MPASKLKIAITADPELPVPPLYYGGIERIIYLLVSELHQQGHDVTLFANADSKVPCILIPYGGKKSNSVKGMLINTFQINSRLLMQNFDVVHSFGRLAYLLPMMRSKLPKIMSYQREPTLQQVRKAVSLAKTGTLLFTGCSNYITDKIKPLASAHTVYNCIDTSNYTYISSVSDDAPLVFLGRIEPIKGTHNAIQIALKSQRRLIIAGNVTPEHQSYFDTKIKPQLNDRITYIGEVNDQQKNALLGTAAALLMPIEWNEPFGIVMIEAMACGTPVIGFNKGAVPEVVIDGVNGYVVTNVTDAVEKVDLLQNINRHDVRRYAETTFSAANITKQYLSIYNSFQKNLHG